MDWWFYVLISSIPAIMTFLDFEKPISQEELNDRINNISVMIQQNYTQDEQLKDSLEKEIRYTTQAVKKSRKINKDKYNYYRTLGILYGYASEISNIERNRFDCYLNFSKAIETKSNDNEAKYLLVTEILTTDPYSTASLVYSIRTLESLLNSTIQRDQRDIYELLIYTYKCLGAIKPAIKYAYQYINLYKKPDSVELLEFSYHPYFNCIDLMFNDNGSAIYRNKLTGYEIVLDSLLQIQSDLPYSQDKHDRLVSFLQIQTQKAITFESDSIYNNISIRVYRPQFSLDSWLLEMKVEGIQFADFNRRENDSIVFSKQYTHNFQDIDLNTGINEPIKGIITIIKGKKYYYLLQYTATESTYRQNLKYFKKVEKNFTIIEIEECFNE